MTANADVKKMTLTMADAASLTIPKHPPWCVCVDAVLTTHASTEVVRAVALATSKTDDVFAASRHCAGRCECQSITMYTVTAFSFPYDTLCLRKHCVECASTLSSDPTLTTALLPAVVVTYEGVALPITVPCTFSKDDDDMYVCVQCDYKSTSVLEFIAHLLPAAHPDMHQYVCSDYIDYLIKTKF